MKTYYEETFQNSFDMATEEDSGAPKLSILLPVFNEEPNLRPLHAKLQDAIAELGQAAEVIYVDDGSTDKGLDVLRELAADDWRVRVIAFKRNYGKAAAIASGIDAARGRVLVTMDADLQNDPVDIKRLLQKLDEGYDVVSGWRRKRQDSMLRRKVPSVIANRLISFVGGVPLHDYGCCLKAYRRASLEDVRLYGEMHRFTPIFASWNGARVTEIEVEHHPRTMGVAKFGKLSRTFEVIFDLITIKFMAQYRTKPMYLFGYFGLISIGLSALATLWALIAKLQGVAFSQMSLPVIAIVLFALGVQFILMGLIADMLMRTYYESQAKPIYSVREVIGFEDEQGVLQSPMERQEQAIASYSR